MNIQGKVRLRRLCSKRQFGGALGWLTYVWFIPGFTSLYKLWRSERTSLPADSNRKNQKCAFAQVSWLCWVERIRYWYNTRSRRFFEHRSLAIWFLLQGRNSFMAITNQLNVPVYHSCCFAKFKTNWPAELLDQMLIPYQEYVARNGCDLTTSSRSVYCLTKL